MSRHATGGDYAAMDLASAMLRARAGDLDAYDTVVVALHPRIVGFVATRCPLPAVIDEIVHDSFVAAYRGLSDWRGGDAAAYVMGIARNLLARRLRAVGRGHARLEACLAIVPSPEEDDDGERIGVLRACLEALSAPTRALLLGRYVDRLSLRALAERDGRGYEAAAKALARARDALRQCVARKLETLR